MKKFFSFLFLIVLCLLTGCTEVIGENQFALPDLTGKTKEQIIEIMSDYDVEYTFYFEEGIYTNMEYDQFVRYGNGKKAGSAMDNGGFIRIYITPLLLTYHISENIKIDFEYEGKSFINDGAGIVTLSKNVDGDTARFYDPIAGTTFRLRFLGIDTPESTIEKDPWGKAASNYCAMRLSNAKQIILESEGARTDMYGRYLGWVWLDGELYNLQVVEEAYSNSTCTKDSKYFEYFSDVDLHVSQTGRRFFGETDPNYDYENKKFI